MIADSTSSFSTPSNFITCIKGRIDTPTDAAGNRIKTGETFARSNIPPAFASASYNDNNQQTTSGASTEMYDLTESRGPSLPTRFAYDSFGQRTGKTINRTTTNFLYCGLNPVQEQNGETVTANLLADLGIDEFLTRTDSMGALALLPDALGSTVAVGDNTATMRTQYTYEPFGMTAQAGAASTNSYKFTSLEYDGTRL